MDRVRIGTSGWTYDGWRGPFYPEDVPHKKWLQYYASGFSTTEINGAFYRTPPLFDNDQKAAAPSDTRRLRTMVEG
jgi:uncharacterized protein YecE (DUF72 family)